MSEEKIEQEVEEVGKEVTTPVEDDGSESETTNVLKIQRERIKELEDEKAERELTDAKKQLGGRAEAGGTPVKKKEETPKEYRERVNKEMAAGKTEW